MAFQQYPDSIAVIISDGAPYTIDLGGVTPDDNQQLAVYRVQLFKRGLQPTVRMRVNAYVADVLQGESQEVLVSTIEGEYDATDNFYGWVSFTFSPRFNLNAAAPTRFELELTNYTYSENQFMGVVLDWPVTMGFNTNPGAASSAPVALELYGAI
jgi:hypothetical protein